MSLEKEIFTDLAKKKELVTFLHEGYWKDVGQFKDYLDGQWLFIKNRADFENDNLEQKKSQWKKKFKIC